MRGIDGSVYPDLDRVPTELKTDSDRADYVHRVCGAWDHGIPPTDATVKLFSGWKRIFDDFPIAGSASYHAFRSLNGWEPVGADLMEAGFERSDRREGRTDPFTT